MKKKLLIASLILISICSANAGQNNDELLDSLIQKLNTAQEDSVRLNIYNQIFNITDDYKPEFRVQYSEPAMALVKKTKNQKNIAFLAAKIGRVNWRAGKFDDALNYHFEALKFFESAHMKKEIALLHGYIGQDYADGGKFPEAINYFTKRLHDYEELGNDTGVADTYILLAWVYGNQGNFVESMKMNFAALKIFEASGDKYSIAVTSSNIADTYLNLDNLDEALNLHQKSAKIFEEVNDLLNAASSYIAIGGIYFKKGNYLKAIENYNKSLEVSSRIGSHISIAIAYSQIAELYVSQGNYAEALKNFQNAAHENEIVSNIKGQSANYCEIGICLTRLGRLQEAGLSFDKAKALLATIDSKIPMYDYLSGIQELDSANGDWQNAYLHFKNFILIRDSLYNNENTKKLLSTQVQYEFDKKEAEAKAEQEKKDIRQRLIRNGIIAGLVGALIFLGVVYRQRNRISEEKKRSDNLLLNILPEQTAEELKATGTTKAKEFAEVTVLFTDFKNFTTASEQMTPQELVNEINYCYSEFDKIITRHGIEKIKTIGDAYMCAGGLPIPNQTHAEDAVNAALDIRDFMESEAIRRKSENKSCFEIRIGLHTGHVVAGIVGIKKFAYDIWGDTVNIAARMESSGETGKVNISGTTHHLINTKFSCIHRGKIQAKNKGEMDMYFVERLSAATTQAVAEY